MSWQSEGTKGGEKSPGKKRPAFFLGGGMVGLHLGWAPKKIPMMMVFSCTAQGSLKK